MYPTLSLVERAMVLLGADSVTLSQTTAVLHLHLAKAPFTPGPTLTLLDLTEADFAGYAALNMGEGPWPEGLNPNNGDSVLTAIPPTAGYRWESTGAVSPSQTIAGWFLTDNTNAVLYGSGLFANPPVISGTNQIVVLDGVSLSLPQGAMY